MNQEASDPRSQQPQQSNQQIMQEQMLQAFWNNQQHAVEQTEPDFKTHTLPIARIKKVMKSDVDVKPLMISAEAPIMFARACEIFIEELTLRAWMHAEEHKRRTVQKSDIGTAVAKNDMYDFLIDIIPREGEAKNATRAARQDVSEQQGVPGVDLYETQYPAYSYQMQQESVMYTPNAYQTEPYTMQQQYQHHQYEGQDDDERQG